MTDKPKAQPPVRSVPGAVAVSLIGLTFLYAGAALVYFFLPPGARSSGFAPIGLLGIVAFATVAIVRAYYRDQREQEEAATKAREEGLEERKQLREKTRRFAEFLEDQYSWVLEMSELEQRQRGLQRREEIQSNWAGQNEQFQELRSSDQAAAVLEDLGEQGRRMLKIWERRRNLYQYAIAFSTEEDRAKELARLETELAKIRWRLEKTKG